MKEEENRSNWNELDFISWREFKQMAPSIIQLEISRMGKILDTSQMDKDFYNSLVKARFELRKFKECLEKAEKAPLEDGCASHLRTAILSISIKDTASLDEKTSKMLKYIADRLNHVHDRVGLIFQVLVPIKTTINNDEQ